MSFTRSGIAVANIRFYKLVYLMFDEIVSLFQMSDESEEISSDDQSSCDSIEASGPEPEPEPETTQEEASEPSLEPVPVPAPVCEEAAIKQEPPEAEVEYDCPSSPDVPNDPELDRKVEERFQRTDEGDKNACARCGLVYVMKRPKKEKSLKVCKKQLNLDFQFHNLVALFSKTTLFKLTLLKEETLENLGCPNAKQSL